jgi:hypothetical protein
LLETDERHFLATAHRYNRPAYHSTCSPIAPSS